MGVSTVLPSLPAAVIAMGGAAAWVGAILRPGPVSGFAGPLAGGVALGIFRAAADQVPDELAAAPDRACHWFEGTVDRSWRGGIRLDVARMDGTIRRGKIEIRLPEASPPPGSRVRVLGRGIFRVRREESAWTEGLEVAVLAPPSAFQLWRTGVRSMLAERLRSSLPTGGDFFCALLLGETAEMPGELGQALRKTGTAHLVVVSGLHFILAYGLVGALARFFLMDRRWIWVAGAWTALYGVVAVFSVPMLRAFLMVGLHMLARVSGRAADGWTIASIACVAIVLVDPEAVSDPSFQLSFLAVAALLVTASGPGALATSAASSLCCWALTLPVVAGIGGTFAPGAVPANMILGPLFNVMTAGGFLLLAAAWIPGFGDVLGILLSALYGAAGWLALRLGDLPLSGVSLGPINGTMTALYYLVLAIGFALGRRGTALAVAPLVLVVGSGGPVPAETKREQSSGVLAFQMPGGGRVVVPRTPAAMAWFERRLVREGERRIDILVLETAQGWEEWHPIVDVETVLLGPAWEGIPPPPFSAREFLFLAEGNSFRAGELSARVENGKVVWNLVLRTAEDTGIPARAP